MLKNSFSTFIGSLAVFIILFVIFIFVLVGDSGISGNEKGSFLIVEKVEKNNGNLYLRNIGPKTLEIVDIKADVCFVNVSILPILIKSEQTLSNFKVSGDRCRNTEKIRVEVTLESGEKIVSNKIIK